VARNPDIPNVSPPILIGPPAIVPPAWCPPDYVPPITNPPPVVPPIVDCPPIPPITNPPPIVPPIVDCPPDIIPPIGNPPIIDPPVIVDCDFTDHTNEELCTELSEIDCLLYRRAGEQIVELGGIVETNELFINYLNAQVARL
jgi:hypothetical protein